MDSFTKQMIDKVMEDEHSAAKALAYFMFREIVEDIHAEGKITDEEMKGLNKAACNRGAFLLEHILPNEDLRTAFRIEAINCTGWDPPEIDEELERRKKFYEEIGSDLSKIRKMGLS